MSDVSRNLITTGLTAIDYLTKNDASRNAAFAYILGALTNVGGSANAITADVLFDQGLTALQDGATAYFEPAYANTGPVTIDINSLGPVALKDQTGTALSGGELEVSKGILIVYRTSGTPHWRILSPTNTGADKFIGLQMITATGTYVPTSGTTSVFAIGQAAGGGSGGAESGSGDSEMVAGSGGAGETRIGRFVITGSVSVTIGAVGSAGSSSGGSGGTAGDLIFGSFMTCKGGTSGSGRTVGGVSSNGSTPTGSGGFRIPPIGNPRSPYHSTVNPSGKTMDGGGGDSWFGRGGRNSFTSNSAGEVGSGYGSGAGGAVAMTNGSFAGAAGAPGMLLLLEFGTP